MPTIRSILYAIVPGLERLCTEVRDAQFRIADAQRERRHTEQMAELRRKADLAFAERNAAEAEHDREVVLQVLTSPTDTASELLRAQCDIERQLVERAGLRKIRETIFSADIPGQAVAQVLAGLSGGGQMRLASPPAGADGGDPGVATQVDADTIERLAMLFVTRVGTASDPAERERLFNEWRAELRRQLPSFQADEVEAHARRMMSLVA